MSARADPGAGSDALRAVHKDGLNYLDAVLSSGELQADEAERLKGMFQQLFEYVQTAQVRERDLIEKARKLREAVRDDALAESKAEIAKQEIAHRVRGLVEEKDRLVKLQADAEQREGALRMELNELTMRLGEAKQEQEGIKEENGRLVDPVLKDMRSRIDVQQRAIEQAEKQSEALTARKLELREMMASMREESAQTEAKLRALRHDWGRIRAEPDRLNKQTESVTSAITQVRAEIARLSDKHTGVQAAITDHETRRNDAQTATLAADDKLHAHRERIEERERDTEELKRNIRLARDEQHQLQQHKAELVARLAAREARLRTANTTSAATKQRYERATRELRRRIDLANQAKSLLPMAEAQIREVETLQRVQTREVRDLKKVLEDAVRELDVLTLRLRAHAGVEDKQKEALEVVIREEQDLEATRDKWRAEEAVAKKNIAIVKACRDKKQRELEKVRAEEAAAEEDSRMKALAEEDLRKQDREAKARLNKAQTLYEKVKGERNALVNAIQTAAQALAERKERVKILSHELHILRNESSGKDAALSKERAALTKADDRRDQLRTEANREHALYQERQSVVESQIVAIDRLNGVVNRLEREMLRLKDDYEAAVEARNYAGVQLIDRNDELCILYEKSAVHDEALRRGEAGMQDAAEEMRAVRLRQTELERELRLARARFPQLPKLAARVLELQRLLSEEMETTAKLSKELEDPSVAERWAPLRGEDDDEESLREKVAVLEAQLGQKREVLLEKELVLEEVSGLVSKLRGQVESGRDHVSGRAQETSTLRARVKQLTRRMMAVVSELSMWQSTALKLEEERHTLEERLSEAQTNADEGRLPSEEAERMLVRLEQREVRRQEAAARRAADTAAAAVPMGATRTTAEPRPNAYIPEGLGLPKPYGQFAPFKPTVPGSSMRHIRRPNPKPIEV